MTTVRENIKKLLDERANAWETTGKPLADIAAAREFTAEERGKFEQAEEAFRGYSQRISALELTMEQERAVAEFGRALDDDTAVRAAIETELRSVLVEKERRFSDVGFTGRDVNDALQRALSVGTATAGGNTVPKTLWDTLVVPLRQFSPLWAAGATVITTEKGEDIAIPRVATFGAAAPATEGNALTGTDPSFDQVGLKAFKFGDFRGISTELIEDSAVDIEGLVMQLIGQNIGFLFGQKLTLGTGSGETRGIVTAATVGVTGATGVGGVPTFDNLIDLQESVIAPYQVNASWLLSNMAFAAIRKIKDTTGQYLWQPSVQVGVPDVILGRPAYRDPYMAAPGVGAKSVLFGDVSAYWIRVVNALRIERSEHALFGSDQVAYRGVLRGDGALVDPNAVKVFQGGAS